MFVFSPLYSNLINKSQQLRPIQDIVMETLKAGLYYKISQAFMVSQYCNPTKT